MYKKYLTDLLQHIDAVKDQQDVIKQCALAMANSIANDGMIHVTGCGHSQMFAHEMYFRAGGLVQINAILPPVLALSPYAPMSTFAERQHGLAAIALDAEKELRPRDILIVVSTSGRNPVPVEFALEGKKRGLIVIGLTSYAFTHSVTSRHQSGKKLKDVCDFVLDMGGLPGDAIIPVPNQNFSTGSISSVIGFTILNSLVCECVKHLLKIDKKPLLWRSVNAVQATEFNQENLKKYKNRVTCM
ncbi:sugar isomerase domain-containing protein [Aeromonas hydrophila]|uniref:sugar isomerase domain-containing protein n=1 Tax=Aeromonas hydrophila TaxID=644 RepID=UPI00207CDCA8|nr:SIS domain-containing protein [Aeromonas hydrophila]MCO4214022.1 SIS domain-containing protein [Aeromonas hydrophila]HDX8445644.1 SIS domain-containing protein [Aeromonas hydrophila]HDX8635215.1 SIS domain-containing protein [Aeromonas hydrophila]